MSDDNKDTIPFAQLFETFRQNMTPGMLSALAEQLGVSSGSLEQIGVGYNFAKQVWVTPERDASGEIIGLSYRPHSGSKFVETGSKRGLAYALNPEFKTKSNYTPGKHNWIRVSHDSPCPLCGRSKWCMVSADNPADPAAVMCGKAEGAVQECGNGTYLHIRKPEGDKRKKSATVLAAAHDDSPILIVEGFTDTVAGLDLGFPAIGKPAAKGGMDMLRKMPLSGKTLWVIGENDAGVGLEGMEKTFLQLQSMTRDIVKVMPPKGVKDLREWLSSGLTHEALVAYVEENGVSHADNDDFEDSDPSTIAERWVDEYRVDEFPGFRKYRKEWFRYRDGCYITVDEDAFRGHFYRFFRGRKFKKTDTEGNVERVKYVADRKRINDVLDATNAWCPIDADPPCWLDDAGHPEPKNLIPFQNGVLDVAEYCKGNIVLYPASPALFSFNILPYDFDPDAHSDLWDWFVKEIFNGDEQSIRLLAEWMGYNCVPDITKEKFMLLHGPPRSGKGTILDVMCGMLGKNQYCSINLQDLCSQFGMEAMLGKWAAIIGDAKTPRARESDVALEKLLNIIGGDGVTVNRKFKPAIPSTVMLTRFTIAMNELPVFTDHNRALESRLLVLPFDNSYVGKEDHTLKDRLRKEAKEGKMINFALQGLKQLRANKAGLFTVPRRSLALIEQFRKLSTPIFAFLEDCCELAETLEDKDKMFVQKEQLFAAWEKWCKRNNRSYGAIGQFTQKLRCVPVVSDTRRRVNGVRAYVYQGVRLTPKAQLEYLS